MNKVIQTILSRKSCRNYSNKKISEEKLNQILQCGVYAPSGKNTQNTCIIAVSQTKLLNQIRKLSQKELNRDCFYHARVVVIVKAPKDSPLKIQDGSCVLENMMIAATALKVDSCWINQLDSLLQTKSGKNLRKELKIQEDEEIIGSLALGYKEPSIELPTKERKEGRIIRL